MKKLTIIIIAIIFFAINAFSQNNKKMELRKFDVEEFMNTYNGNSVDFIENECRIQKFDHKYKNGDVEYVENISFVGSLFHTVYFYYSNGNLKEEIHLFDNNLFGIETHYSIDGKITEEINHEKHFKYSIYDVIEKFKELENVDISKPSLQIGVWFKYFEEYSFSFYEVSIWGPYRSYLIDGVSGEIFYKRDKTSSVYIENLKKYSYEYTIQEFIRLYPEKVKEVQESQKSFHTPKSIEEEYPGVIFRKKNKNQDEHKSFWQRLFK